jgi:CRP-like cAMP-binding protein
MCADTITPLSPGRESSKLPTGHERLIRTLLTIAELSDADQDAIHELPGRTRKLQAYEDIVCEGDRPNAIAILVDGFACRYKTLPDGRRQIVSFHIAGDPPDLQSLYIDTMDHSISTLCETTVLHIAHDAIYDLLRRSPHLGAALWRWTLIDASVFREWVTNLGRRDAFERIAHLLCEVMARMRAVGLTQDRTCELPLTQADLGDAAGLSSVHANRTLQALRSKGLIQLKAGSLTILDWEALKAAGLFDEGYLHLRQRIG